MVTRPAKMEKIELQIRPSTKQPIHATSNLKKQEATKSRTLQTHTQHHKLHNFRLLIQILDFSPMSQYIKPVFVL